MDGTRNEHHCVKKLMAAGKLPCGCRPAATSTVSLSTALSGSAIQELKNRPPTSSVARTQCSSFSSGADRERSPLAAPEINLQLRTRRARFPFTAFLKPRLSRLDRGVHGDTALHDRHEIDPIDL